MGSHHQVQGPVLPTHSPHLCSGGLVVPLVHLL